MTHVRCNPIPALRASVITGAGQIAFPVPPEQNGELAGVFLRRCGVSAKTLRAAKRLPGGITQNGELLRTVDAVRAGAVVSVLTGGAESPCLRAEGIDIPVLYEDAHMLAFNKPAGIGTHPSGRAAADSLLNFAWRHFENGTFRPLGRLDKNTSGVLLTAKTAFAATALKALPDKDYLAVAEGAWAGEGVIDLPIGRADDSVKRRSVLAGSAPSVTRYRVLAAGGGHSLLLLRLETGRTHQIRVHLSHLGHPLAGDALYGGGTEQIDRQALHALRLSFQSPFGGGFLAIEAPVPDDIAALCGALFGGLPEHILW